MALAQCGLATDTFAVQQVMLSPGKLHDDCHMLARSAQVAASDIADWEVPFPLV